MAGEVEQLEKDMQKVARDLAGNQPGASARVRDGLSDLQQNEAKLRMKYSANWIRQGQGGFMVPREAPITEALDKVSEDLKKAQSAMNNGSQNGAQGDKAQSLARVEQLRSQMQQMAGRGQQQGGQQQGGQQQGGQQQGGQQQGGQQQGQQPGGQQPGGQQGGGRQGAPQQGQYGQPGSGVRQYGGQLSGPRNQYGRYMPEGIYDVPNGRPADSGRVMQDASRALNEMRQQFKDNPDMAREIADLEHEISRLGVGNIATQELQNRLNREILPNLEALELKLRRQVEEQDGGNVRSGATDKVPAGYTDAVAEYFRKLSKGK